MSYHVYISKEGFKETPIELFDWLAVARQLKELCIHEKVNRKGFRTYTIHLVGNERQWLQLDVYGLVHAQDPSRELVMVMLEAAQKLNAQVYSERLKPYKNIQDWEKRTKKYRENLEIGRQKYRLARRKKAISIIIIIAFGSLAGWFLGKQNLTIHSSGTPNGGP